MRRGPSPGPFTAPGIYTFAVEFSTAATPTRTVRREFVIHVAGALQIATTDLPPAVQDAAYLAAIDITGGTAPFTWSIISGALPAGLTLSNGLIQGTPTAAATYTFTVGVQDSAAPPGNDSQTFVVTVVSATDPAICMSPWCPTRIPPRRWGRH